MALRQPAGCCEHSEQFVCFVWHTLHFVQIMGILVSSFFFARDRTKSPMPSNHILWDVELKSILIWAKLW